MANSNILIWAIVGAVIGWAIIHFIPMDIYNIFYSPLSSLSAQAFWKEWCMPIVFIGGGALLGLILGSKK